MSITSDLCERLGRMSMCVYLAAAEEPAADLSDGLTKARLRLHVMDTIIAAWKATVDHADTMPEDKDPIETWETWMKDQATLAETARQLTRDFVL